MSNTTAVAAQEGRLSSQSDGLLDVLQRVRADLTERDIIVDERGDLVPELALLMQTEYDS